MWDFAWGTPIRKLATSLITFFGIISAAGGAARSWPDIEPYTYAQKKYVNERLAQLKSEQQPILDELKQGRRERLEDQQSRVEQEKSNWQIKLPTETDQQTRGMIQERLNKLEKEKAVIDKKLEGLK